MGLNSGEPNYLWAWKRCSIEQTSNNYRFRSSVNYRANKCLFGVTREASVENRAAESDLRAHFPYVSNHLSLPECANRLSCCQLTVAVGAWLLPVLLV